MLLTIAFSFSSISLKSSAAWIPSAQAPFTCDSIRRHVVEPFSKATSTAAMRSAGIHIPRNVVATVLQGSERRRALQHYSL
jgi:hypothetical protein